MSEANNDSAKLHATDYWQVIRNRYGIIILAFLLIFMTAAVITYILPKKYESTCLVQINQAYSTKSVFNRNQAGSEINRSPRFLANQFKIINSKMNLQEVVDGLNLVKEWDMPKENCYAVILSDLEVEEERGTDLIKIYLCSRQRPVGPAGGPGSGQGLQEAAHQR